VDHHQQHHEHHRKEREEKKAHEHERELRQEKQPGPPIHPLWFWTLGVVLTVGVLLVWLLSA
jgi:hypothetical protein